MSDQEQNGERLPTGIAGLDTILGGGVFRGGIYIVQGAPGAGKTIFGNQICFSRAAAGERALYVTLLAESHARMMMHMRRLSFFDESAVPDRVSYFGAFKTLENDGLKGLLDIVRRELRASDATLLVLDGLITVNEAAGSDLELKKFIHELQTQAVFTGCTMFLLTSALEKGRAFPPEHTMVDGLFEISNQLQGRRTERRLEVRKLRGSDFLSGTHAFCINNDGIIVFPRLEATVAAKHRMTDQMDTTHVSIGVKGLDAMLGGGIARRSATLLVGSAGSGKTTFGLQFLSALQPGEKGLLFSFNEDPTALRGKAAVLRLPLLQMLDSGQVDLLWHPSTEGIADQLCAELLHAVRSRNVKRLVIDDVEGFARISVEKDRINAMLTALSNELRAMGVTTLATAETALSGIVPGQPLAGLTLTELSPVAENIVALRLAALDAEIHRLAVVLKARDNKIDLRMRRFEIDEGGVIIEPDFSSAERILRMLAFQSPIAARPTDKL